MDNETAWGGLVVAWVLAALPIMSVDPAAVRRKLGVPEPTETPAADRSQTLKYWVWIVGFLVTLGMWQAGVPAGYGMAFTVVFSAVMALLWRCARERTRR